MERLLEDWEHEYKAIPWEYPVSDNIRPATYDQFITLRNTLVYTNKYYASSAWRSLIIWTKLEGNPTWTIEIREPNIARLIPWWDPEVVGNYVTTWWHSWVSCEIQKKGRYRLQHKEQFNNIDTWITRIHTYILQHKADWTTQSRAVFDWEWGSAWAIVRLTAFGYVECDLNKWDWLEFKAEDQNGNDITSAMETDSNWIMVEYIDLAYNI
jgi:hypothetical protein